MTNLKRETPDGIATNVEKIAELFPGVVAEGKVNFDILRTLLGDEAFDNCAAAEEIETYQLTWVGKREAMREAGRPVRKILRPCVEESKNWDTTENLYIEGDNLDVLKLLQESCLGKVKMVYIDPPYNTGNNFVYRDKWRMACDKWQAMSGEYDKNSNRIGMNAETNGRFHSDWCSMIYPRLVLARNLLRNDGVIFISIDDHEVAQLRKISDEIFGEDNFIAQFTWIRKKKGAFLSKKVRKMTEFILCYQKDANEDKYYGEDAYSDKMQPLVKRTNAGKKLTFPPGLVRTKLKDGNYAALSNDTPTGVSFLNPFTVKNGMVVDKLETEARYVWTQDYLDREIHNGTTIFLSSQLGFNVLRSNQKEKTKTPSTLLSGDNDIGTNEDASLELAAIFHSETGAIFDYAKPTSLMKYLCRMVTYHHKDSIILDFFSGSATTAHAVMQLNAEDGGNRKFIMVQLPEACDEKSEAFKAGYKNICEIGKERIRRAGEKIVTEAELTARNLDTGFRVLKLDDTNMDDTNMKDVYYT